MMHGPPPPSPSLPERGGVNCAVPRTFARTSIFAQPPHCCIKIIGLNMRRETRNISTGKAKSGRIRKDKREIVQNIALLERRARATSLRL